VLYDSKKEADFAKQLDLRLKAKDIKYWIGDKKVLRFPVIVNGRKICTYTPDFEITHNNGLVEYVDVKGVRTPIFNLKWKLIQALYPELIFNLA
jgi:predicted nuclease of restriction endonuclease-like RecB superfamily